MKWRQITLMNRQKLPVINCISNIVTVNDCANILLAAGFSPIMADEPMEMEEIAQAADACVINLGTPSERKYEAAAIAGVAYNRLGKPVVIDPVGVAVSHYRLEHLGALLKVIHPDVIRCNLNEARALCALAREIRNHGEIENKLPADSQGEETVCGVDSRESRESGLAEGPAIAKELAWLLGCVVLISGAADIVSDGELLRIIEGGSDRLKEITGSGCMLSALTGGFCARKLMKTGTPIVAGKLSEGRIDDTLNCDAVCEASEGTGDSYSKGDGLNCDAACEASEGAVPAMRSGSRLIYDAVCEASEGYKRAAETAEARLSAGAGTGELRMKLIDAAMQLRE